MEDQSSDNSASGRFGYIYLWLPVFLGIMCDTDAG